MKLLNSYEDVIKLATNCEKNSFIDSITILLRILDNIIREPHNDKYRTIRLENKIIKEKLLCLADARKLLDDIGFIEENGTLTLPTNILIARIRGYRDMLARGLEKVKNYEAEVRKPSNLSSTPGTSQDREEKATTSGAVKKEVTKIVPLKSYRERIRFEKIITFNNVFLQHLEERSDHVQQYEDDRLQYYGRKAIPLQLLTENALNNMRAVQKQQNSKPNLKEMTKDPCFRDWLLVELAKWFNEKFFTWVNSLPCKVCGKSDLHPSNSVIEDDVRVEITLCCNTSTKFHRYNDVAQLMKTRKGRCGEYANCFTFLCRCLGYETRLVDATFDHVWTEVFSVAQKKWIHVDPSDNVVDAPLMYQHGWKRNVDYIFAFSNDDIQDVTWRYASNHDQLIHNRRKCSEKDLLKTILLLREKRQRNCTAARKRYLLKRNLMEIVELMVQRQPTENEKKGRSSGSLNWKLSRGEGQQCANNFFVFSLNEIEASTKQFNIRYSCSKNCYDRFIYETNQSISIIENLKTWQSCVYQWENIFRKEERDWKMVYLARVEDTEMAAIEWKFDFSARKMKIKNASLTFDTKGYESGQIHLEIVQNGNILPNIQCVQNLESFSIRAKLCGGNGDCAWQHTQLFRQSIAADNEYPFELKLTFY